MWTALLLQLSVQLAWCQETLDGSNGSSHQPACDDQTAMLQFQVDSTFFGQKRNDECVPGSQEDIDLNAGTCGADGACVCTPDPDPQTIGPFNNGVLDRGGQGSCSSDSSAAADRSKFFQFADSSNYLDCSGQNSCRVFWNVENVGAACCTGQNSCFNQVQIHMDDTGGSQCTNDMCCSGINACKQSEVRGVDNLLCADNGACDQIDAEISG
ncbi:unnamed protein product, partial [Durusdinium trenchii]